MTDNYEVRITGYTYGTPGHIAFERTITGDAVRKAMALANAPNLEHLFGGAYKLARKDVMQILGPDVPRGLWYFLETVAV